MGRVRTKTVKRSARLVVERFYSKLCLDFHVNKRICDEVTVVPSKRMRNKIAGFVTHLMRRIEGGANVRGISLKLQEEERERRLDFVPKESALRTAPGDIKVDKDTRAMLKKLGCQLQVGDAELRRDRNGNRRGARKPGQA
eukprot:CAMPEP_0197591508 /NCGR_PEP_ID=MMETSP1326-20131121/13516_1 /TAXON_ID=1155430 /ORGANISM="Genus nov. species nov., Strain RCC2288" /LENGTH=140 /DNA_ID=CAMNT_0043156997 /DNA_START=81 /DNA_END=500 /DNA_ORIENTATION=-